MSLSSEVAKNNVIFAAGNIVSALFSFIFSVVVAGLLQPEQFGLFSFVLVITGFFTIFIDLGTSSTMIKFMAEFIDKREAGKAGTLLRVFLKFRVSMSLAVGLFMVLFSNQIAVLVFNKPDAGFLVMLAAGLLIANSVFDFVNMLLVALKSFKYIAGLRLLERLFRLAFVVSIVLMGFGAVGAVGGVILGFVVMGAIGFLLLMRYKSVIMAKRGRFSGSTILKFSFWSMLGYIITSLYTMTDTLLVSMLRPTADVGFYSIASSWMSLIIYVVPVSSLVMLPYFSSMGKERNSSALKNSMRYIMLIAMPIGFLMSAFSAPIIRIFYGGSFISASGALGFLSLVAIPMVISQVMLSYFYGIGKPKLHGIITAAALAANVILNVVLIGWFGIAGAAAGTLLARIIEISIFLSVIAFSMKVVLPWHDILKPLAASLVIYILGSMLAVQGIVMLVVCGVALLAFYVAVMVAIGGLGWGETRRMLGTLKFW
jgi:O-antigen/teichoic acid export membrane protein